MKTVPLLDEPFSGLKREEHVEAVKRSETLHNELTTRNDELTINKRSLSVLLNGGYHELIDCTESGCYLKRIYVVHHLGMVSMK